MFLKYTVTIFRGNYFSSGKIIFDVICEKFRLQDGQPIFYILTLAERYIHFFNLVTSQDKTHWTKPHPQKDKTP